MDISFTGMMLLNNSIGCFITTVMVICFSEELVWDQIATWQAGDWCWISVSCVLGLVIGWTGINAAQHVSATMMMVISNLDKALIIFITMLTQFDGNFFVSRLPSWEAYLGVSLAFVGGLLFTLARARLYALHASNSCQNHDKLARGSSHHLAA